MSGFSRAVLGLCFLALKASFNEKVSVVIWFVLALCLLVIAAIILWPFLRAEPTQARADIDDWDRASLKAALAAIDKDEARGILKAEAADAQRADIAKKAQNYNPDSKAAAGEKPKQFGFIMAAAMLLIAPCLLFGGYIMLGTTNPKASQEAALAQQIARQPHSLEDAIISVEKRIEAAPDNGNLWALLGDLKIRNEDLTGAEAALEKAVKLPASNDAEKARLWLILAMTRRSQGLPLSDASVKEPLEKSLELDANSPAAILLKRANPEPPQP